MSKNSNVSLALLNSDSSLSLYLREINSMPMLSEQEEYTLSKLWHEKQDLDAAHKLVTSHLRLVAKVAMSFRSYGLPVVDLISEGNIGLMHAIKKFDPDKGYRLSTYAMWWIRAAIQDYILKSWSILKMGTAAAKKRLFSNFSKVKNRLGNLNSGNQAYEEIDAIAKELNVPRRDVIGMNNQLNSIDSSLNISVGEDGAELQDLLQSQDSDQETILAEKQHMDKKLSYLYKAMEQLDERSRVILEERRLAEKPKTLEYLSTIFGVSQERIRQIEVKAFDFVKKLATEYANQDGLI